MAVARLTEFARARLAAYSKVPWSLGVALGLLIFFAPHPEWHLDLALFREQNEILRYPVYAHWLFAGLGRLPEPVAYVVLSLATIGALYAATRAFAAPHWMVFTSFAFAWILFYGQLDGLVAGGLALAWWAARRDRPVLAGAGLILAALKPQLSLPALAALWWWSPSRLKSSLIPAAVLALSFVTSGFWLPAWFRELGDIDHLVLLSRNLSLWPELGNWVFLVWPLVLGVPASRKRKLAAVLAATAFSSPYFPLPSAIVILSTGVPWWTWALAQLPVLSFAVGAWIYFLGKALPIALLLWALWPGIARLVRPSEAGRRSVTDVQ
jgi:hypothetical protein